ncbi:THADA-like protein, partial [Mya arenaria]
MMIRDLVLQDMHRVVGNSKVGDRVVGEEAYCGVEQDDTFNLLRSLTNADNAKHLVDSFKKVSKCIQKRLSNEGLESVHRHIEYLVQLFFVCTTKNPLRRVLIRHYFIEFLVDCKTTSAMNICLMLKCCSPEIDILHLLSKTAFGHLTWVHELVPSPSSPLSWAANLPLDRLSKTCLSPSSYLCFCYGMLTMAAMETLLGQAGGKVFLLHGLLPDCSDVGSKLLAAKSVCFLTQRIRDNLAMTTATDDVWGHFHGDSVAMQTILQFVFTAWEDAIDAVRFTVRDIFQNVLAIHIYFLNRKGLSIMDDPFLHKLTCTILHDVPWSCKGKYGTLAALASELYEKLFLSHMFEILVADQADTAKQTWFSEWVEPVIRVLCGPTTLQKKHTIEYVLPRLLKCGENVLADMVHWLSGRLTEKQSNIESGNVIGALILCLRRARAMGQLKSGSKRKSLLEENSHQTAKPAKPSKEGSKKKTSLKETEECSTSDMENISQQSKDLWLGIVDVGLLEHALVCKDEQVRLDAFALLCENQKTAEPVENCEILLVKRFIPSNLNNQNSAFRQQFTALIKKLLLRMKESSGPLRKQMSKTPAVKHHLQNYMDFLQWLRGCMLDSLYPGAVFAQKTTCLTTLALLHAIFGSLEKGNEAGCGFSFFPGLRMTDIHTLLFCLTDTFEDNKHEAARILKTLATHSETQCLMYIHPSGGGNDGGSLTGDTGTAHISQVTGAVTIPDEYLSAWRQLLKKFISLYMQISAIVSPVVCNSSPEGNVPTESLTDLSSLGIMDADSVARSHETVMLMPEYLTVCCWRTVKEISLILGQLTSALPLQDDDGSFSILNSLLLESKHRGAFELAYAGFVKVTEVLWRSPSLILLSLPSKWLGEVMSDIRSHDSRLCATRRSAGVPFYVQALVTTEPSSTGRQCFRQTVQELLGLALDQSAVTMDTCTGKVHALNILRALYKDSRLKDDVAPFIADGLRVAILGFKSPLWAEFSHLVDDCNDDSGFWCQKEQRRVNFFKEKLTGRTFFYNYPILYQFLLGEIAMATEDIAHRLHPGLFPVLMVLGRLFPSAMEGTDTSLNLPAFIPYVIKCSASPVMKTREMAAKALQPLVDKDHVTTVFSDLMTLL